MRTHGRSPDLLLGASRLPRTDLDLKSPTPPQMSKQRIGAACCELEIYGLAEPAVTDLTDDQRHVLYILPPKEDSRSVTYRELP